MNHTFYVLNIWRLISNRNRNTREMDAYSKVPTGKTWMHLLSEAEAPIKAPAARPAPEPGVNMMLSGTPVNMVFPRTTRFPLLIVMFGVIVIFI